MGELSHRHDLALAGSRGLIGSDNVSEEDVWINENADHESNSNAEKPADDRTDC
jgi:hypothetical protein